jgi:uncharacterized protein (TIGR02270 family)
MLIELGQWMPDILEEHVEELTWLWPARQAALRSPEDTLTTLGRIERRIAAHTDALVLAGENAEPLMVSVLAEDEGTALAATVTLLEIGSPGGHQAVVAALEAAEGDVLEGIRGGLCLGPIEVIADQLRAAAGVETPAGAVAAEALARHGDRAAADWAAALIANPDPSRQIAGWHVVACLALEVDAGTFADGVRSDHPGVRRAALETAAWLGNQGVLPTCRTLATQGPASGLEVLELLAVLGSHEDLHTFHAVCANDALGPERLNVLASYGHPRVVESVLECMEHPDARTAAAAGAAFERMTGLDVSFGERAAVPPREGRESAEPAGPSPEGDSGGAAAGDPVDADFEDEVVLPDPGLAWRLWEQHRDVCVGFSRIAQGQDASLPPGSDGFDKLDLLSRNQSYLRGRYSGAWRGGPTDPRVRSAGAQA